MKKTVLNHLTLLLLILMGFSHTYAQDHTRMRFDEMWKIVEENNILLKNAENQLLRSQKLKGTSWDLGMTKFQYADGDINAPLRDHYYSFEQELGNIFEMSATHKYWKKQNELSGQMVNQTRKMLWKVLAEQYYSWIWQRNKQILIQQWIDLFVKAVEYSNLQFLTGETSMLSKTIIETRLYELRTEFQHTEFQLSAIEKEIDKLLNSEEKILPAEDSLYKLNMIVFRDSLDAIIQSHPEIGISKVMYGLSEKNLGIVKSGLGPNVSVGYLNQQIEQIKDLRSYWVELSIPLWFAPQRSRIQAAKIDLEMAGNQLNYTQMKVRKEIEKLFDHIELYGHKLDFYNEKALPNAKLITVNATSMYQSGEIGYLEFVQNMSESIRIQEEYIDFLKDYNLLVINLNSYYINE
ncbi:MAG: TolC family protein [Bacteroidales bacterium]|nr:TolC family protein [Bacteroidales bacterium]